MTPNPKKQQAAHTHLRTLLLTLLITGSSLLLHAQQPPDWWTTQNLQTGQPDDYATANQGQLKHTAFLAFRHIEQTLTDGAAPPIKTLIDTWFDDPAPTRPINFTTHYLHPKTTTDDYTPINLGQLKHIAQLYYDHINTLVEPDLPYPWSSDTSDDNDHAPANLGQLKHTFTFPIPNDTDHDGLPDTWETLHNLDPHNPDTDHDGMNDGWEHTYGLDPLNPHDATTDTDSDGLTNLQEYTAGTNPTNPDTDHDGLTDAWEHTYALNPLNPDDATLDPDNDTLTNLDEHTLGTNPTNPDTDGDSMSDQWETANTLNPTDPTDATLDPDNDTLTNQQEQQRGSNPNNPDTDNDGINDPHDAVPFSNFLTHPYTPTPHYTLIDLGPLDTGAQGATSLNNQNQILIHTSTTGPGENPPAATLEPPYVHHYSTWQNGTLTPIDIVHPITGITHINEQGILAGTYNIEHEHYYYDSEYYEVTHNKSGAFTWNANTNSLVGLLPSLPITDQYATFDFKDSAAWDEDYISSFEEIRSLTIDQNSDVYLYQYVGRGTMFEGAYTYTELLHQFINRGYKLDSNLSVTSPMSVFTSYGQGSLDAGVDYSVLDVDFDNIESCRGISRSGTKALTKSSFHRHIILDSNPPDPEYPDIQSIDHSETKLLQIGETVIDQKNYEYQGGGYNLVTFYVTSGSHLDNLNPTGRLLEIQNGEQTDLLWAGENLHGISKIWKTQEDFIDTLPTLQTDSNTPPTLQPITINPHQILAGNLQGQLLIGNSYYYGSTQLWQNGILHELKNITHLGTEPDGITPTWTNLTARDINDHAILCGTATHTTSNVKHAILLVQVEFVTRGATDDDIVVIDGPKVSNPFPTITFDDEVSVAVSGSNVNIDIPEGVIKDAVADNIPNDLAAIPDVTYSVRDEGEDPSEALILATESVTHGVDGEAAFWRQHPYKGTVASKQLSIPRESGAKIVRVETGANGIGNKGFVDIPISVQEQVFLGGTPGTEGSFVANLAFTTEPSDSVEDTLQYYHGMRDPLPTDDTFTEVTKEYEEFDEENEVVVIVEDKGTLMFGGTTSEIPADTRIIIDDDSFTGFTAAVDSFDATLYYFDGTGGEAAFACTFSETGPETKLFRATVTADGIGAGTLSFVTGWTASAGEPKISPSGSWHPVTIRTNFKPEEVQMAAFGQDFDFEKDPDDGLSYLKGGSKSIFTYYTKPNEQTGEDEVNIVAYNSVLSDVLHEKVDPLEIYRIKKPVDNLPYADISREHPFIIAKLDIDDDFDFDFGDEVLKGGTISKFNEQGQETRQLAIGELMRDNDDFPNGQVDNTTYDDDLQRIDVKVMGPEGKTADVWIEQYDPMTNTYSNVDTEKFAVYETPAKGADLTNAALNGIETGTEITLYIEAIEGAFTTDTTQGFVVKFGDFSKHKHSKDTPAENAFNLTVIPHVGTAYYLDSIGDYIYENDAEFFADRLNYNGKDHDVVIMRHQGTKMKVLDAYHRHDAPDPTTANKLVTIHEVVDEINNVGITGISPTVIMTGTHVEKYEYKVIRGMSTATVTRSRVATGGVLLDSTTDKDIASIHSSVYTDEHYIYYNASTGIGLKEGLIPGRISAKTLGHPNPLYQDYMRPEKIIDGDTPEEGLSYLARWDLAKRYEGQGAHLIGILESKGAGRRYVVIFHGRSREGVFGTPEFSKELRPSIGKNSLTSSGKVLLFDMDEGSSPGLAYKISASNALDVESAEFHRHNSLLLTYPSPLIANHMYILLESKKPSVQD